MFGSARLRVHGRVRAHISVDSAGHDLGSEFDVRRGLAVFLMCASSRLRTASLWREWWPVTHLYEARTWTTGPWTYARNADESRQGFCDASGHNVTRGAHLIGGTCAIASRKTQRQDLASNYRAVRRLRTLCGHHIFCVLGTSEHGALKGPAPMATRLSR